MMTTYDDRTEGVIESGRHFILPVFEPCAEVTFKASYIVASNVKCSGKITALFDLIVLGNIEATELDIKGKFVCLGKCEVSDSIIVQNEIWANDIRAENIETRDRIVAQDIDGGTIVADGSIVVGKILAVERFAKSEKIILCGETAYGSGKVAANAIITGEPLDLDDGEEAVVFPSAYSPRAVQPTPSVTATATSDEQIDLISHGEMKYAPLGDFQEYLDFLISSSCDDESRAKFSRWQKVISEAAAVCESGIEGYTNVAMVIWLVEIVCSAYFKNWKQIDHLFDTFEKHFKGMLKDENSCVSCSINSYDEWLAALSILKRFGVLLDSKIHQVVFELVVSKLGLKAKFVSERLSEKGWEANVE